MRYAFLFALLLAACGSTPSDPDGERRPEPAEAGPGDPTTRIVYRQYPRAGRKGSPIFIVENLAGREMVKLRSQPLEKGQSPVAYVPDDVMRKMLSEFKRFGFFKHAKPRPKNPIRMGGIAELTLIDEDRRMKSIIPTKLNPNQKMPKAYRRSYEAYKDCKQTFLAVWNYYRPFGQVTTTEGNFGGR